MKRGDVYWYDFGGSAKRRPVLVLTGTRNLPHLSTATVAAITTTVRGTRSEVTLSTKDGLPRACAVNLHQLHTIEQARVGPLVTQLSGQIMKRVEASLGFALGFDEPVADS